MESNGPEPQVCLNSKAWSAKVWLDTCLTSFRLELLLVYLLIFGLELAYPILKLLWWFPHYERGLQASSTPALQTNWSQKDTGSCGWEMLVHSCIVEKCNTISLHCSECLNIYKCVKTIYILSRQTSSWLEKAWQESLKKFEKKLSVFARLWLGINSVSFNVFKERTKESARSLCKSFR